MIHGMTGFGRGEAETDTLRVSVDLRTVNHRHLDIDLRGTPLPPALDVALKKRVARAMSRGKCEVAVVVRETAETAVDLRVNEALVKAHVAALRRIGSQLGLDGPVTLDHLALLPWNRAFELGETRLDEEGEAAVFRALETALRATLDTRASEGSELAADLGARLVTLESHLTLVRAASADIAEAHRRRLLQRLSSFATEVALDEHRIAQEAALLADRADIAEELSRFGAYLERLGALLTSEGPQGKRLDFILQEALREVNTMGSKARGLDVSNTVIDMKTELERMREQVANVE